MSLMTRIVATVALVSAAAIPVAALTIKNTSSQDVKIAVDNGSAEAVYTVPANGSVDVKEDCSADCAVTGPWGYSRLVDQNATIETDGGSLVTANVAEAAPAPALVPQNPVAADAAPAAAEPAATASDAPAAAEPVPAPRKQAYKPRRKVKQAQKKGGPTSGSFQMLFEGPGK